MNEIELPVIPAGIILLVNFFAPYAVALVVSPYWPKALKRFAAIIVSLVLAAIVLLLAYFGFGLPLPAWPALLLLAVLVSQTSYDLILKSSASKLAATVGTGSGGAIPLGSSVDPDDPKHAAP